MPFLFVLFILASIAKLAGFIGLSWLWITALLWLPLAVGLVIYVTFFLLALVGVGIGAGVMAVFNRKS